MKDIDTLSIELTKAAFNSDKLPLKLRYRIQKWLAGLQRGQGHKDQVQKTEMIKIIKQQLINSIQQVNEPALAKNEVMASTYSDGSLKLDFGSGIPAHVKKAALNWAKRRGLKPVEASLDKAVATASFVVLSKSALSGGECLSKVKWAIPL